MDLRLEGKKALITGGSRGIGKATAEALAKEKVKVAIVARGKDELDKIVGEIGGKRDGHMGFSIDLMDENGPRSLFEELQSDFGEPEIVVHNLGGSLAIRDQLCSINEWRKVWRLNMEIPIEINI